MLAFGSVFERFNSCGESDFFVYLIRIGGSEHVAKIIYGEELDKIFREEVTAAKNNQLDIIKDLPLFCYAILKTKEIQKLTKKKDNAAHLGSTQYPGGYEVAPRGELNQVDKKKLQDEILGSADMFPKELIDEIKKISIIVDA